MNKIPQVLLVVAALLLILPTTGSSDPQDFLENFLSLSQSDNSSVLSAFFGTAEAEAESSDNDGTATGHRRRVDSSLDLEYFQIHPPRLRRGVMFLLVSESWPPICS